MENNNKLYVIPTPIGNLEDITFRALRILKEVDTILAEDTRTTVKLLSHFEIKTKLQSHHKFNEHKSVQQVADRILAGEKIAIVSDAGTPGISDPGFLLVRTCIANNIEIETLPGATAFVPALVNSGFPCDKFCFEGFLPQKKGRQKHLKQLVEEERTIIFYESPFRIIKFINELAEYFGLDRNISISREISKIFEETTRGTIAEVLEIYKDKLIKGEFVIIIEGKKE